MSLSIAMKRDDVIGPSVAGDRYAVEGYGARQRPVQQREHVCQRGFAATTGACEVDSLS
jgi:hypothetical protein